MSVGEPFRIQPLGSLNFRWEWSDWGTGGDDWSIISCVSGIPAGYAKLGSLIHYRHFNSDSAPADPNNCWGVQFLMVRSDRPDAALPCTGYQEVRTIAGDTLSKIWRPTHTNSNYIGVGDICYRGATMPPIGAYYCVNRKYLIDAGKSAGLFWNDDGVAAHRTIDGLNLFRTGDPQKFGLRDDQALQACCTGSGTLCELWSKGSTSCQAAMTEFCTANDIKPGGKCEDWCTRDPISCDKVKNKFCVEHPDDPFCDCINALDRPDHSAFIKDKETIYSMSIPACYYNKCKQGPYKVFTTTEMVESQQGTRCSQDLKYIDQQIKVLGSNNVLNTDQNVNENQTNIEHNQEPKILGYPQSTVLLVLLVILAAAFGYYTLMDDGSQAYQPPPGYTLQHQQVYTPPPGYTLVPQQ